MHNTEEKTIKFDSLIGLHTLDAVDLDSKSIKRYDWSEEYEDCNTISFRLDGIVYTAIEDPDDGYRSSMAKLIVDDIEMQNTFPGTIVLVKKKENVYYQQNDTLQLIDIKTGGIVLEAGTDNFDDYYPYFVGSFFPENMALNKTKKDES